MTILESHHHCCTLLFSARGPRWAAQPLCISAHCSLPAHTESPLCACSPQTLVPAAARTPSWATGSPAITCKCTVNVCKWDSIINIYCNKLCQNDNTNNMIMHDYYIHLLWYLHCISRYKGYHGIASPKIFLLLLLFFGFVLIDHTRTCCIKHAISNIKKL